MDEVLSFAERVLSAKTGENIVALDMREVNPFTDYYLLVTAKNVRHANALAEDLIKEAHRAACPVFAREGTQGSTWILIDLGEVVVHIFTSEAHNQYRLESLWADRPLRVYQEENEACKMESQQRGS